MYAKVETHQSARQKAREKGQARGMEKDKNTTEARPREHGREEEGPGKAAGLRKALRD